MKIEIITGGWCKGDKIVDGIIRDRRTGKQAFDSKFNADAVEQLRRHDLVQEAKR